MIVPRRDTKISRATVSFKSGVIFGNAVVIEVAGQGANSLGDRELFLTSWRDIGCCVAGASGGRRSPEIYNQLRKLPRESPTLSSSPRERRRRKSVCGLPPCSLGEIA
jgi:hypothetical protein